ncbi:MAG: tripartite tricarboxylate transporter TctB [Burkholderiales bacterium RIFCSPHIGHO2_12_FULL_61_11]|nr:MAG: tripartite tricarboxylate transporter TctB [Burkholderiales bacterium RIFCSPHIGHO2_12_FULL_61_11]
MESTDTQSPDGAATGPANYLVDAVVAIMITLMGGMVIYGSKELGSGWTSEGPGSGYFPFYIGLILSISGLGILYQALFAKKKDTAVFVDGEQIKRVLSVLIPAGVYVLAVQFIGLYVASFIYIALFMMILGKFSWIKSIIAAFSVNALFFLMFEVWFKVPLFKGEYDMLSFLGY